MCESELDLERLGTNTPESAAVMRRLSLLVCFAAALTAASLLGCSSTSDPAIAPASSMHLGGQTGGEAGIRCGEAVTVEPLAFGADSPLGFSGADIAGWLPKTAARPLAWTDGTSAVLDLSLTYTGTAGYAAACRANAVDVTLGLTTSDGAFAEAANARLFSASAERASLDLELAVSTLSGSLTTTHAPLASGSDRLLFQIDFANGITSGRIAALDDDEQTEIAAF